MLATASVLRKKDNKKTTSRNFACLTDKFYKLSLPDLQFGRCPKLD